MPPRVVLGVCGSIAAYKAVELCRRLVDAGFHVVPVMTEGAERFVGAATLSALASERVRTSLWDGGDDGGGGGGRVPHVTLGRQADLVLVAPATARLLGSYAAGISDDLLTNLLLVTRAPVVVCPAMHTEMWEHPATRANVEVLEGRGIEVVHPDHGRLAGGDEGPGRLPEADRIVAVVSSVLAGRSAGDLAGRRVLVTAGGTREPIDAVRYLGNRSSGKQGAAIAAEAASRGAEVVLVTAAAGGGNVPRGVEVVLVETAAEMEAEVLPRAATADAIVMAAAVADFRPKVVQEGKLRKADGVPDIVLEPTTDILAALGRSRRRGQVIVGFAAEPGDVRVGALEKLRSKQVDAIVANDVTAPGAGFGGGTNEALIVTDDGAEIEVPMTSKRAVAAAVVDLIAGRLVVAGGSAG